MLTALIFINLPNLNVNNYLYNSLAMNNVALFLLYPHLHIFEAVHNGLQASEATLAMNNVASITGHEQ